MSSHKTPVPNKNAKRVRGRRLYYAVRVGYARGADTSAVRIRSSIFFHWDDAHHFVTQLPPFKDRVEYATFSSIEDAEAYLVEGERKLGRSNATGSAPSKKPLPTRKRNKQSAGVGESDDDGNEPKSKRMRSTSEETHWGEYIAQHRTICVHITPLCQYGA